MLLSRLLPKSIAPIRRHSLVAAVVLLAWIVVSPRSHAAPITYSGVQNLGIPTSFEGVYLNFTNATDATAFTSGFTEPGSWDLNPFFGGSSFGTSDTFLPVLASAATNANLVNLGSGTLVDVNSLFPPGFSGSIDHMGSSGTQFLNNTQGYLGFVLNPGVDDHYGWMRVTFRDDGSVGTIHDWAWDTTGTGIFVGSTTAVPFVHWDSNGNTTGTGGSGVWSSTSTTFATSTVGTATGAQTATAELVFGGTAGTVTVSGTVAPTLGLRFGTTDYELTGGTVQLAGADAAANTLTTESGVTVTLGSALTGSNGMTKSGAGTLVFTGDKTFTGGTLISGGTLQLGNGVTQGSVVGDIENNATLAVNNDTDQVIGSTILGTGQLTKSGTGTTTLTATNIYTGTTQVNAGALQVGSGGTGTTGSGAVTVASGSTILGTGLIRAADVTLSAGANLRPGDGLAAADVGTLTVRPASGSLATDTVNLQGSVILGITVDASVIDSTFGGNDVGSAGYLSWLDNISALGLHDHLSFENPDSGDGYNVDLTGTLTVESSGFSPQQGMVFNLFAWESNVNVTLPAFSGYFVGNGDEPSDLDLPDLTGSGLLWDASRLQFSGNLAIVPEPSRPLLFLVGLSAALLRRRRC